MELSMTMEVCYHRSAKTTRHFFLEWVKKLLFSGENYFLFGRRLG